jgi:ubiquitin
MLCRADHGIHEDQEVVCAAMFLLVFEKKIHEGLLKSDHGISFH